MQDVFAFGIGALGILGLTIIEIMALFKEQNGQRQVATMTTIGAIAGFAFGVGVT